MKWLSSLDELLYEIMSWLLFFPLTLWRAVARPLAMMAYADRQLTLPEAEQYAAAINPPLFLALSLLIGHAVSLMLGQTDAIIAHRSGLAGLVKDDATALVVRIVVFAGFALFPAARYVRRRGVVLDRASLRLPFYAQCYPVAVLALGVTIGVSLIPLTTSLARTSATALILAAVGYYAVVETRWFADRLAIGHLRAAGAMALSLIEGVLLVVLLAVLFAS